MASSNSNARRKGPATEPSFRGFVVEASELYPGFTVPSITQTLSTKGEFFSFLHDMSAMYKDLFGQDAELLIEFAALSDK